MSLIAQAKLLRVLEERRLTFRRTEIDQSTSG
jgi:hypothetical protein